MNLFSSKFCNSRFFKTTVLIFSKLVVQMSQLLLFVFLTRLLSKSDYGAFRQIAVYFTSFLPFFLLGLPSGLIYFYNKNKLLTKKYFFISVLLFTLFVLFAQIITVFFLEKALAAYFNQEKGSISLFFLWLWGTGILTISVNSLVALKKPISSAVISFLYSTLFILAVFSFTFINQDFTSLIKVYSIAPFCLSIFALIYGYKAIPSDKRLDYDNIWKHSKKLLTYSIPMCFSTSIGGLNRQIPLLIGVSFLTAEQYAVFANGCLQIPFIASVISSAIAVITPDIIEGFDRKKFIEVRDLIYKVSLKTAYIIIPIFLYLYVNAEEIIVFIFTDAYKDAVIPFRILLLAIPARVMYFGLIFISAGRTDLIFYRSIFSLVICALSAYLISLFNPLYSAFGFIISIYFWAIPFNLFWFKKLLKVEIFNQRHMIILFYISIVSALSVFIALSVKVFAMPSFMYIIISSSLFGLIYFLFYVLYFRRVLNSHKLMII